MLSRTVSATMSNEGRVFNKFERLHTLDEIKDLVKDQTLAIVIGKGKVFDSEELKKISGVMGREVSEEEVMSLIHTWLNEMLKETVTDLATNGSDYNKKKDDGSVERSTMYEMASKLECDVIGVTHPNNVGSCKKFVGNNTKWLIESDGNGWGDLAQVRINLNPIVSGDMVINYWPANDTAWTDSDWITILDFETDGVGPEMRRLDGGVLIDPFETDFVLDIPVVLAWSISTVPGIVTPQVEVTDFDPNNGGWTTISSQAGNYNQRWKYSDSFKLDRSTFSVEDTIGFITPDVGDRDAGFVYP